MSTAGISPERYWKGLDGIRGMLVLYVFTYHASVSTFSIRPDWVRELFGGIRYTMPTFFLLSGFLLSSTFNERSKDGLGSYFVRRIVRIWPIYLLSVLLMCLVFPLTSLQIFLQSTFLFGFFMHDRAHLPNDVAWSLFNEEIFYLLVPILLPWMNFFRSLLALLGAVIVHILWVSYAEKWGVPSENFFIWRFFLAHVVFFIGGVVLYFSLETQDISIRRNILLAILIMTGVAFYQQDLWRLVVAFVVVLWALHPHVSIGRVFLWWPLCWIGRRCYFIYLFHALALRFWSRMISPETNFGLASNLILLGIIIALAGLSWSYIEYPMIRWAKQRSAKFAS